MKKYMIIGLVASAFAVAGCNDKEQASKAEKAETTQKAAKAESAENTELKTLEQKISYFFGFDLGMRMKQGEMKADLNALKMALEDAGSGKEPRLSQEELQKAMRTYQEQMQEKRAEAQKKAAETNKKEGEAFLAENAKKDGVVTTKSGLQYKIVKKGTGPSPTKEDKVTVHYRGTLVDGTEFDSSYGRGEPVSFPVKGVISGWTEALQLMKEGAKWELYIPSDLAYGPGGTSGKIGPNATLIFEVELLKAKVEEEEEQKGKKEAKDDDSGHGHEH